MKKFYVPTKGLAALAVIGAMAVGCGLGITNVEFSTHEVKQGENLTVTTTWHSTDGSDTDGDGIKDGDGANNGQGDYYLVYAMRVPEDWSGVSAQAHLVNPNPANAQDETVDMIDCPAYATYVNFFFPKEGYKWVAWQTEEAGHQGTQDVTTAVLKAGKAMGDFTIDIMAGGWKLDPSKYLLNADGSINFDLTFGLNLDRSGWNEEAGTYWKQSEYLMLTSTISKEEFEARRGEIAADASLTATPSQDNGTVGSTRPLWLDVANRPGNNEVTEGMDMNVKVVEGEGGIDGVAADAAEGAAIYFDLQGRKVANPNAGIYLVKRGAKVSKEVVR